jgi:hypothetical protein
MKSFRPSELKPLVLAAAIGGSIPVFFFASYIIFGDIHEGGHALACLALGGNVGGFRAWLHGVLPFRNPPGTDCSIKPYSALVWAAGPLTSIVEWVTIAFIVNILLNCATIEPSSRRRFLWSLLSVFWVWWCLWFLGELFNDARHAYAPPSVRQDSTQFVHVTGINPDFVGRPLGTVLIVSAIISAWISWRLLKLLFSSQISKFWRRSDSISKTI